MNITDFLKRRKSQSSNEEEIEFDEAGEARSHVWLDKVYLSLVIILIAGLSFGIGRLTVTGERNGVSIEFDTEISNSQFPVFNQASNDSRPNVQTANTLNAVQGGEVVASKNSTKYHYSHCPGAKQIAEKNKIVFRSASSAESSGYTLAGNCKPR